MTFEAWLGNEGISEEEYDQMDEQEQQALHFEYGQDCDSYPEY